MMHELCFSGYRLCPDSYHNNKNSDTSKNTASIIVILEIVVVTVLAITIIMPIPSLSLWSLMRISA